MPKSFTDLKRKVWHVRIDLESLERVKDQTNINLMKIAEMGKDPMAIFADPVDILRVLIALLEPEDIPSFKKDISDGDVLDSAGRAILDGVIDFLPRQQRSLMRSIVSSAYAAEPAIMAARQKRVDRAMRKSIAELTSESEEPSSNSQESQGSIPDVASNSAT